MERDGEGDVRGGDTRIACDGVRQEGAEGGGEEGVVAVLGAMDGVGERAAMCERDDDVGGGVFGGAKGSRAERTEGGGTRWRWISRVEFEARGALAGGEEIEEVRGDGAKSGGEASDRVGHARRLSALPGRGLLRWWQLLGLRYFGSAAQISCKKCSASLLGVHSIAAS
jgi:hypothetical protein